MRREWILRSISLLALVWMVAEVTADIVSLPQGDVQGHLKTSFGRRKFLAFEGIPFGKPPVGKLRFEAPEPAEGWNGTLVANKIYACLQYFPIPLLGFSAGSEDCLYIYVYVPRTKIERNESLDVVAYIHGGGFMLADPVHTSGPDYIMDKEVIFVTFNYRLSMLGFLSTEDDVVPGNNGLKDQALALRWIQENIAYFGGNPNSVTLYGISAGAVSTHFHYLSPMSRGLFHRGFSQSGSALMPWAIHKKPLDKTRTIAEHFSCPTGSNREMVECLRKLDGNRLVASSKILTVFLDNFPTGLFGPVVEMGGQNPFIPDHPYKLLQEGKVYDVPWVASNVMDEGIFPTVVINGLDLWKHFDDWTGLMPYLLDIQDTCETKDMANVTEAIRRFYFNDQPLSRDVVYDMVKLLTDRLYKIDSEKAIRLHAKAVTSPVFYYLCTYEPLQSLQIPFMPRLKGVQHTDDAMLIAPLNFLGISILVKGTDKDMMHEFVNFLENYAKGNMGTFDGIEWLPLTPGDEELNVLNISSPSLSQMQKMNELAPQKFWNSLSISENEHIVTK